MYRSQPNGDNFPPVWAFFTRKNRLDVFFDLILLSKLILPGWREHVSRSWLFSRRGPRVNGTNRSINCPFQSQSTQQQDRAELFLRGIFSVFSCLRFRNVCQSKSVNSISGGDFCRATSGKRQLRNTPLPFPWLAYLRPCCELGAIAGHWQQQY